MLTRRPPDNKNLKNVGQPINRNITFKKAGNGCKSTSIVGWTGTDVADENDLVTWMIREKKEENNKRKKHSEESEENYRHVFTRCTTLIDWEEFQLQSLPERYRPQEEIPQSTKNDSDDSATREATKTPSESKTDSPQDAIETSLLYQTTGDVSDDARAHKNSELCSLPETDVRIHDDDLTQTDKMSRLKDLAEKFGVSQAAIVSGDAHEENGDEGYDSKLSSIEEAPEDPIKPSEIPPQSPLRLKTVSTQGINSSNKTSLRPSLNQKRDLKSTSLSPGGNVETGPSDPKTSTSKCLKLTLPCNEECASERVQRSKVSTPAAVLKEDSVAKLSYSRTDKNVYDTLAGDAKKIGDFRYAGRERSRLMEVSLRQITPGYLDMQYLSRVPHSTQVSGEMRNRSTHSADRSRTSSSNSVQQQQQQAKTSEPRPQSQNNRQPKYLTLTKISLQDGAEAQDQDTLQQNRSLITSLSKAFRLPKPTKPPTSSMALRVPKGPKCSSASPLTLNKPLESPSPATHEKQPERPPPMERENSQHTGNEITEIVELVRIHKTSSPPNSRQVAAQCEISGDKLKASPSLPLIPCINQNISNSLTESLTNLSKNLPILETALQTSNVEYASSLPSAFQQNEDHSSSKQSTSSSELGTPLPLATASCEDLHSFSLLNLYNGGREETGGKARVTYRLHHNGHRSQGFRPYNSLSPLQRAKDIAYRRIHGYLAYLPDGSETVKVTSPQYIAPRVERLDSTNRHLDNIISGLWRPS